MSCDGDRVGCGTWEHALERLRILTTGKFAQRETLMVKGIVNATLDLSRGLDVLCSLLEGAWQGYMAQSNHVQMGRI
jgi:hypothetical protein